MVPGHRSGCQATSSQSSDNSFQSSESSKGNPDNRVTDKTEHLSQTYSGSISADSSSNVSDGANVSMEMDQDDVVDQQIVCQCLSEPVLCREAVDGEVPSQLRELFGTLQPENELEVLGVVLHVLMLEMGFIVVDKVITDSLRAFSLLHVQNTDTLPCLLGINLIFLQILGKAITSVCWILKVIEKHCWCYNLFFVVFFHMRL